MFEAFQEMNLHVVELPISLDEQQLPVYSAYIQEYPFMQASASSKQALNGALMTIYYQWLEEQKKLYATYDEQEQEEMTSSLLSYEELLKYYDGEQFDGFAWSDNLLSKK